MDQLMLGLLMWLGAHSNYKIPDYLPAVEYRSSQELYRMFYGDIPGGLDVLALFDKDVGPHGTTYVNNGFDINNKTHHSNLLHELTHFLQNENKVKYPCTAAREPEAYKLQRLWLKEQNLPDPFDDFAILDISRCGQPL